MKPVAAIYSTFLQRAYDQVVHDVCLQNLDVTFALDRAGLVGADGATHQGLYDLAYLRTLPNIVRDGAEGRERAAAHAAHGDRVPGPGGGALSRAATGFGVPLDPELKALPIGEAELLRDGDDAVIVALGTLRAPGPRGRGRARGARASRRRC